MTERATVQLPNDYESTLFTTTIMSRHFGIVCVCRIGIGMSGIVASALSGSFTKTERHVCTYAMPLQMQPVIISNSTMRESKFDASMGSKSSVHATTYTRTLNPMPRCCTAHRRRPPKCIRTDITAPQGVFWAPTGSISRSGACVLRRPDAQQRISFGNMRRPMFGLMMMMT